MPKNENEQPQRPTDPDLLQLIGAAMDLLGLGEHVQRLLPLDRVRAERRHTKIEKLRSRLIGHLDDSRAALRVVRSVLDHEVGQRGPAEFAIAIPANELPVFRRGLDRLQVAIREMTKDTYELEAATSTFPEETSRYYRMSQSGRSVLTAVREALDGNSASTRELLDQVERYLARCSELYSEGESWRSL